MAERWEHYRCTIGGQPAAILVDLGAMEQAPDRRRPLLVSVRARLRRPRMDGLSTPVESARLQRLEELLLERMARADATYVGRITHQGTREFCFYLADEHGVRRLAQAALDEAGYRGALVGHQDPEWQHYRRYLWPERPQMQSILDRRMVHTLGLKGDDLEVERPVAHWVAFASVESRDALLLLLDPSWSSEVRTGLESTHPIGLSLTFCHSVTLERVRVVVGELQELVETLGGVYEAWQTCLVRRAMRRGRARERL